MNPDLLLTIPTVEIQAAAAGTKRPTVSILAYGGGFVRVAAYPLPIAIDLSGLNLPGSIPLLIDHNITLGGVAGQAVPVVRGGKLFAEGFLSEASEAGARIAAMARDGITTFGASVGALPEKIDRLRGGETVTINGQTLTAPPGGAFVARAAKLREISLSTVPADDTTAARIAATLKKGNAMPPELNPSPIEADPTANPENDPVIAERQRIRRIEATVSRRDWGSQASRVAELKEQAIEGEISFEAFQGGLLDCTRAERPNGNYVAGDYNPHGSTGRGNREILAAATLMFMGRESVAAEAFGERVASEARSIRANTMLDICQFACQREGIEPGGMGKQEMIRAALSTYSLPVALGDAANKVLLQAYNESPATWRAFANVQSVPNFKEAKAVRPTAIPALADVPKGGELEHATIGENTYAFAADTFGRILKIDRRDIINDDLSLFDSNSQAMGRSASRSLADLIYKVLLANAGSFFASGNGNLGEAGSALASGTLSTGVAAMLAQRDAKGFDLDIAPRVLLVPPELRDTALSLLQSEFIAAAESTNLPTGNIHKGTLQLAVEPRLSNSDRFAGASATGWYLFASPADAGLVVAFLDGRQSPVIEFFGFDKDPDTLAATWRVYFDYGAALADPKAAYRATGAGGGE